MGADAFVAYCGVRYILRDEELDCMEARTDQRFRAARDVKLRTWWGRLTEGEPYHMFIGTELGIFGVQGETHRSFNALELERIMDDTRRKLAEAGLPGEPLFHFQLEAQY